MTDLFKPTYLKVGTPHNRTRPPTSIRPPTEGVEGSRTDEAAWSDEGPGTSGTAQLPTYAVGDLLIVNAQVDATDTVIAVPSGWTELMNNSPADSGNQITFYKVADGSEGATVTIPMSVQNAPWIAGVSWVHRGLPYATFPPDTSSLVSPPVATTINPPQITMSHGTSTYDVYVVVTATGALDSHLPASDSDGYDQIAHIGVGTGDPWVTLFHKRIVDVSTEDPATFTMASNGGYQAHTIAVLAVGPATIPGIDHTHVEADVTDLDHWTETDHDLLDHTGLTGVGGGGGGGDAPEWIAYLTARQTGETGHADDDFFDDGTLAGTAVTGAGNASWVEQYGKMSVLVDTQGAFPVEVAARVFALTPSSAPVTLETRFEVLALDANNIPGVMVGFSDGATVGDDIAALYSYRAGAGQRRFYNYAGTFDAGAGSTVWTNLAIWTPYLYVRAVWSAANTFKYGISLNGIRFTSLGQAAHSRTLTPTHFFVGAGSVSSTVPMPVEFDYVRINESDLLP